MFLVIGGSFQGKLRWAMQVTSLTEDSVADGALIDWQDTAALSGKAILNDLEKLLERMQQAGLSQQEVSAKIDELINALPEDAVIICDEVGAGLVPMEAAGRAYREIVGRVCCDLAARASCVVRIYCGLPQVLKQTKAEGQAR